MVQFIKSITDSDQEFFAIMILLDHWVQGKISRTLYIPEYYIQPKLQRKRASLEKSKKSFDAHKLQKTINKFTPQLGLIKTKDFIIKFGGTTLYIPELSSIYRILRNNHIKDSIKLGFTYDELGKYFKMSPSGIRKIPNGGYLKNKKT